MAKIATKSVVASTVTFTFSDGKVLKCDIEGVPAETFTRLALHGLAQKVGDSYSSCKTPTEARKEAERAWANLVRGTWTERDSGVIVEAIARLKGISVEEAQRAWESADDETQELTRKNERVKQMLAIIKGERAKAKAESTEDVDLPI